MYADESGNTGNNLFDPNQPTLWTCCMISNKNVDADGFCRLISRLNLSFHLVELDKSFHATADREVVRLPVDDEGREIQARVPQPLTAAFDLDAHHAKA